MNLGLPSSQNVDTAALSRIFGDVTNSYKFLFFLAFLERLQKNAFDHSKAIPLRELAIEMFVLAWYPNVYFHLSFGKQDQIAKHLETVAPREMFSSSHLKPTGIDAIRRQITISMTEEALQNVMRFAPYRLVRPFFQEISGVKDHEVNGLVAEACATYFTSERASLYQFSSAEDSVLPNNNWTEYFQKNLSIVKGWSTWHFLEYMQSCNPNVPAVSTKLFAPLERESQIAQTKFWRTILEHEELRCIYSQLPVNAKNFALDHFIPWSSVVHNRPWNLIPTSPHLNSSKSDKLPAIEYVSKFVIVQHSALTIAHQLVKDDLLKARTWDDYVSQFVADLGVANYESLLSLDSLNTAYSRTLLPLLQLAEVNGFTPNWHYEVTSFEN